MQTAVKMQIKIKVKMSKKVFEKVTDENATVLWATFCDARATAEELFKKPRYRDTSIFLKIVYKYLYSDLVEYYVKMGRSSVRI